MTAPLKILYIEDTPFDVELTKRELKRSNMNFEMLVVAARDEFIEQLHAFAPDVVLSDHSLPAFSSIEALRICQTLKPDVPFILVTGSVSENFAVECIQEGASDYVLKQSLTRLPSAIINAYEKKVAEKERQVNFKKLEVASDELRTFMYRATHDIRGPICSLKGLINVMETVKTPLNEEQMMSYLRQGVDRLDEIIMDLICTIQLKEQKMVPAKFSPFDLLNSLLDNYRYQPRYSEIKTMVSGNASATFVSDQQVMTIALQSVIRNAFEHHRSNGEDRYIRIELSDVAGGLLISVTDNGRGISPASLDRVFDMFYRGNADARGAGLGLYLTRLAMEKISGRIELNSLEGKGTSVHMLFPSISQN
jgi:signal transduction histidine kinase